jgi:hypothetical protein
MHSCLPIFLKDVTRCSLGLNWNCKTLHSLCPACYSGMCHNTAAETLPWVPDFRKREIGDVCWLFHISLVVIASQLRGKVTDILQFLFLNIALTNTGLPGKRQKAVLWVCLFFFFNSRVEECRLNSDQFYAVGFGLDPTKISLVWCVCVCVCVHTQTPHSMKIVKWYASLKILKSSLKSY